MFPTISIPKLHSEHRLWVDELNFCKEEIGIYEGHLENLVNNTSGVNLRAKVEHFQNQFACKNEAIDKLMQKLNRSEKQLASFVKELSGLGLDSIRIDNHSDAREEMRTFRRFFAEMKEEFRLFEKEWY